MDLTWLPPLVGTAIGGLFAVAGGWIQSRVTGKNERARLAHEDARDEHARQAQLTSEERSNAQAVADEFLSISTAIIHMWSDGPILNRQYAGWFEVQWPQWRLELVKVISALRNDESRERLMSTVEALSSAKEIPLLGDDDRLIRYTVDMWLMIGFNLASAAGRAQQPDQGLLSQVEQMREERGHIRAAQEEQFNRLTGKNA